MTTVELSDASLLFAAVWLIAILWVAYRWGYAQGRFDQTIPPKRASSDIPHLMEKYFTPPNHKNETDNTS